MYKFNSFYYFSYSNRDYTREEEKEKIYMDTFHIHNVFCKNACKIHINKSRHM